MMTQIKKNRNEHSVVDILQLKAAKNKKASSEAKKKAQKNYFSLAHCIDPK